MSKHKALAIILSATLAPVAAWSDPVFRPGSGVGLEPLPGVTVTSGLPNFSNGQPFVSIQELPTDGLTSLPGLEERARQLGARDFKAGGAHGVMSRGTPEFMGRRWRTWIAYLHAKNESIILSIGIPADDSQVTSEAVEAALRTMTFRDADADRMAALPFTVADLEGFRPVTLGLVGAGLLQDGMLELTEGPITPDPFAPQPVITIIPGRHAAVPAADRLAYARQVLLSFRTNGNVRTAAERLFDADGVQWAEIRAVGMQLSPVTILFFYRFGPQPSQSMSVLCTSPVSETVDYSDRFRRLALSVRLKE